MTDVTIEAVQLVRHLLLGEDQPVDRLPDMAVLGQPVDLATRLIMRIESRYGSRPEPGS